MDSEQERNLINAGTRLIIEVLNASAGSQKLAPHAVERFAKNYAERFVQRHNVIRVLAMDSPVALGAIYVRVTLYEKIPSRIPAPEDDLLRSFLTHGFRLRKQSKTIDALSVINETKSMVLLGQPGAGKTTFLKYVGLRVLEGGLNQRRIPLFLSLKDWSDTGKTLFDYLRDEMDVLRCPDAPQTIETLLEEGRFMVLLDGFDEVSGRVEAAVFQIKSFSDQYPLNQFIISCRTAAYQYVFQHFSDAEVAEFDDEQIAAFIKNWFKSSPEKAVACWNELSQPVNSRIKEIATSPLLLTMLCLVFGDTLRFPTNRAELYKEGIDTLLKKWDASRSIKRHEIYRSMSPKKKEMLLSQIAFRSFTRQEYLIPERVLFAYAADFCRNLPHLNYDDLDFSAIIKGIEIQHGLLIECAKGIYCFSHLTFQEYFAARFLIDNEARGLLTDALNHAWLDKDWREVFLLSAGMLANADVPTVFIRKQLSSIGEGKELQAFLNRLSEIVFDVSFSVPLAKAVAIQEIVSGMERLTFLITSIIEGLFSLLNRMKREKDMLEMDKRITKDYEMNLEPLRAALTQSGFSNQFETYLSGTELLVSFLNSDCYLSEACRKRVISSVLSEPFSDAGLDLENPRFFPNRGMESAEPPLW
jgi:hypothetical protein